jgi:hypothetical protein
MKERQLEHDSHCRGGLASCTSAQLDEIEHKNERTQREQSNTYTNQELTPNVYRQSGR